MAEYTREQLQSEIDSLAQKILQYTEYRTALSLAPILKYVRFLCMSDCGNVVVVAENETIMPSVRELVVRSYRKSFPELGHLVLSSFYLTHDERHYLFADDNARARDFSNSIRCYAVFETIQSDLGELTQEPETFREETSPSGGGGKLNLTWKHKLIIIVDSNLNNIVLLAELSATVMEVKELVARAHNQWCPEYGQVTVSSLYLRFPSGDEPAPSDDSRIGDSYPEKTLFIELLVNFTAALAGDLTQTGELTQERATCTAGMSPNNEENVSAFCSGEGMGAMMQNPDAGERGSPVSRSLDEPQDAANYIRIHQEANASVHLEHNSAAALTGDLTQNGELTQERATCTAGMPPNDEANDSAFRSDERMEIPDVGERESPVSRSLDEPIRTRDAAKYIRINQEAAHDSSVHLAQTCATTHGALMEIPGDGLAQIPAIEIGSIQDVHQANFITIQNGASDLRWFLEKAHAKDSELVVGTNSGGLAHEMLQAERLPSELVIGVHNSEKEKFIMNKDLQDQQLVNTSEETDVFAKQTECLRTSMLEHGNQIKELGSSAGDGGYNIAVTDVSHDMNVDACNEHRAWKESPLSHVYDDENMMEELIPGPINIEDGSGLDSTSKSGAAKSKRLSKQTSNDSLQSSRPSSERKRSRSGPFALLDSTEKSASIPSSLRQVSQEEIAALNAMKGCKVLFTTSNGDTIRKQDLLDLLNGKWVNSEIINSYLHLIKLRADRKFHVDGTSSIRVYIYSSFFYTKYATEGYAGVSKWMKNINIFDFDLVLFPINHGVHWSLVGAHLKTHQISYYDSLRHTSRARSYHSIMDLLAAYLDAQVPNTRRNWQQKIEQVPEQADGVSCGTYVCAFAELLARGVQPPFAFSATDIPRLVRGVAADIMRAYVC